MPEIRCPMCSAPNPETAEVCGECGARLKPLVAGGDLGLPPEEAGAPGPPPGAEDGEEDWLARIRSQALTSGGEEPTEEEPRESPAPDWLGRLREADSGYEEGPPEGELPEWMDEFIAAGEESERVAAEGEALEKAEQVPEWLARIRAKQAVQEAAIPEEEDWLERLRQEGEADIPAAEEPPPEMEAAPPREPLEGPMPEHEAEEAIQEGLGAEAEPEALPAESPFFAEDLDMLAEEISLPEAQEEPLEAPPLAPEAPSLAPEDLEGEALPHVPALVPEDQSEVPLVEIGESDLEGVELPDWLEDLRAEIPVSAEEPGEEVESPDLAPATLPSWLEAMRPTDAFRPEIEIEREEEQPVESAGPLAGLRGVLMAEPVVAKPRMATATAAQLEVTERQYAQAELLQRLVEYEQQEVAPPEGRAMRVPFARWAISLVMLVAMLIPFSFERMGIHGYPLPASISPDLAPLIQRIGDQPADRPALVVFDYTPGYTGELSAVAGAVVGQLTQRGYPIATLSTRPTGPPLAERMFASAAAAGAEISHLGYLPGGPTAVQLFSIAPRDAVLSGFHLPQEGEEKDPWAIEGLRQVQRLSDFGLVIVITAGTETARTWAEQTHPWIGETPLIMVLSAGAEPLVRPYYESADPRVDGILTGLPSAVSYRQLSGQPQLVASQWNTFGTGMLAAQLILLAGGAYGFISWLIRRTQG